MMLPNPSSGAGKLQFTEQQFDQVREFLYQRAGLHFAEAEKFRLESQVQKRLRELGDLDLDAYLSLVASPARGDAELRNLLDEVTTHETSFFRNRSQIEAFNKHVLGTLLERCEARRQRQLRIWSAACSSGEEPYTLAMLIIEALGERLPRWDVRILGTDISHSVLEKARQGEYGRHSFRTTPAYFAGKYFEVRDRDLYCIRDAPRRLVEFQALNFADVARMRLMRGFDAIFCRNALIYFDLEAKRRCVAQFARSLNGGGFFFVGHSESLHGVSDAFKLIHFPGALAYQKPLPQ